jgi:hypothetical protein
MGGAHFCAMCLRNFPVARDLCFRAMPHFEYLCRRAVKTMSFENVCGGAAPMHILNLKLCVGSPSRFSMCQNVCQKCGGTKTQLLGYGEFAQALGAAMWPPVRFRPIVGSQGQHTHCTYNIALVLVRHIRLCQE